MENTYINSKILKVWKDYPSESGEYLPLLYPEFKQGGILFVGLNPSFSDKSFKKILKGTEYEGINIKEKLNKKNNDYDFLIWLERRANEKDACDYFTKFHCISEDLKLHYQHIDLFFFRKTNQKEAKKRIIDKEGRLNDFALTQLQIVREIIHNISRFSGNQNIIIIGFINN